jgi:hypothetical protein
MCCVMHITLVVLCQCIAFSRGSPLALPSPVSFSVPRMPTYRYLPSAVVRPYWASRLDIHLDHSRSSLSWICSSSLHLVLIRFRAAIIAQLHCYLCICWLWCYVLLSVFLSLVFSFLCPSGMSFARLSVDVNVSPVRRKAQLVSACADGDPRVSPPPLLPPVPLSPVLR